MIVYLDRINCHNYKPTGIPINNWSGPVYTVGGKKLKWHVRVASGCKRSDGGSCLKLWESEILFCVCVVVEQLVLRK